MRRFKWRSLLKPILLCFCMLYVIVAAVPPRVALADGNWKDRAFYDNGSGMWITEITSTDKKRLTCTVNWNGTQNGVGSQAGKTVHGTFTLVLPAYPGLGAAIVGRQGIRNVSGFQEQTVCNE